MEINYGSSPEFSIGIEEELQLLHAESFELVSRFDEIAEAAGHHEQIKAELLQSVVEVATRVAESVPDAMEEARALRARLREAAAERDALIASAGTHPFSRYEHQEVTEQKRYLELMESLQWVAERELIFGVHVHVGLDSAEKAISVANALRTRLPEILALSANSPFWQGRDTGLASTRTKLFDAFPRDGLPPAFASFEEFELLVERARKSNSFPDYTYIWWNLRPHPRLGTIEVRICDAQTRLESTAAIVALVQSLVASFAEEFERKGALPAESAPMIAENKWRATKDGLDADLVWLERDEERPAREAIRELLDRCHDAARRLGCERELAEVERLLERGSGADEQRRVHEESESLLAVAQWLSEETVRGL
jgi:carboxylate-amine ligase